MRTFTPKELIKFEDFVNSPYHNKNNNIVKLFLEIKKFAPEYKDENLQKEKIWNKLFPDKEYNYGILKNFIHDLNKLCETFILIEQLLNRDLLKDFYQFDSIFQRSIPKLIPKKIDSFERNFKMLAEHQNLNLYLYIGTHFYQFKSFCINTYQLKQDSQKAVDNASDFVLYYFMNCAFVYTGMTVRNNIYNNKSKEKNLLEIFLNMLEDNSILDDLFININSRSDNVSKMITCQFYMFKSLMSNDDPVRYYKFKNFLEENKAIFNLEQFKYMYFGLDNCLENLKLSETESNIESFDLLKIKVKNKFLVNNLGIIFYGRFISAVEIACNVNETDFAENFIADYTDKLGEEIRDNTLNYSKALISFTKSDFEKTREHLSKIKNETLILKYLIKNIYMMTYYDLNEYESFVYAFDSLKHFIKRNKLVNEAKTITLTKFCDYIKILFKLRETYDTLEFENLKKIINENKLSNKTWLLKKLDELESADK